MGIFKTSHSVWQHQVTVLSLSTLCKPSMICCIDLSFHVPSHQSASYEEIIPLFHLIVVDYTKITSSLTIHS